MSRLQAARRTLPVIRPRPRQLLGIAAAILLADQATKVVVVSNMVEGQTIPVIEGVLHWTFVRNPGAAFSLFTGVPWLFTILATGISIWILATSRRARSAANMASFALILGGALGNLMDRVFRGPDAFAGHVVDFIDLRIWPTFNIADSAVVIGAFLLIVSSWMDEKREKERKPVSDEIGTVDPDPSPSLERPGNVTDDE